MKKFIVLALIVVMISSFASADLTTDLKLYYTFYIRNSKFKKKYKKSFSIINFLTN